MAEGQTFYHVDRRGELEAGQVVELGQIVCPEVDILGVHAQELFPDGIMRHGFRYLLWREKREAPKQHMVSTELIFEYYRRQHYPSRPSRFQSMFATDTEEAAELFWEEYILEGATRPGILWEVSAEHYFKADMSLLHVSATGVYDLYCADGYWAGRDSASMSLRNHSTRWEYLLVPPVTVIRRAGEFHPEEEE